MSRLRRIADRDRIFFISTNLLQGSAPLSHVERDIIVAQLARQRADRDFRLFAYVVMPTHVHLLLVPDRRSLIALMYRLKRYTAQRLARARNHRGPIWQPRYFDFALRHPADFDEKLAYIHQNPVKARLARSPEAWRWSSAAQWSEAKNFACCVVPLDCVADAKAWL